MNGSGIVLWDLDDAVDLTSCGKDGGEVSFCEICDLQLYHDLRRTCDVISAYRKALEVAV